ncbi:hypothetical protein Taro_036794 [Colocasia esculenta]|uniref:Uncharacterized protein n=1 Tax=Colocasia esculenta TaxID=4460 RepID=A0A843W2G7_COLES|nr:hypothetical protein [Colocasia esculenta]
MSDLESVDEVALELEEMAGEHAQMHELQQTVQRLTQALNNVSQTMTSHTPMGRDQCDERPGVS